MDFIRLSKDTKFIVFSDSMSSLEALSGFKIEVDLVLKIIKDYTSLIKAGKVIEFCLIPSHVNIAGNERADTAAKAALCLPVTSMKLPASELKPCVSRFCRQFVLLFCFVVFCCLQHSSAELCCKQQALCNPWNCWQMHPQQLDSRRDAVIINRLKTGHSRLTHSYFWRWPTNMYKVRRCIDSEAYTSGFSGMSGRNTSLLLLWRTFLKVLTIDLSLILLKMVLFIINCSTCYPHFIVAIKPCS